MSKEERNELELNLELLKYLHSFHNEYEDQLSMTSEESIEHRLNIMEEIARITRLLREDHDDRSNEADA